MAQESVQLKQNIGEKLMLFRCGYTVGWRRELRSQFLRRVVFIKCHPPCTIGEGKPENSLKRKPLHAETLIDKDLDEDTQRVGQIEKEKNRTLGELIRETEDRVKWRQTQAFNTERKL